MDGRTITILLRLIHILAGIFWVGAAFTLASFLIPAARATGREGGRFMQVVTQQRRLPVFLGIAMALTVLSGFALYGHNAALSQGQWASSAPGIGYGIGAIAAIIGGLVGMLVSGRAGRQMITVGQRAAGSPTAEQQAEIERLQIRTVVGARITAALLAVAAGAMAVARYL